LTENWSVMGRVGYARLLGDVADSPIVDREGSANAYEAGVFVGYRF
jgi:outer membrane scaffolding protein for murein synthesis (MipA/OmpV family)